MKGVFGGNFDPVHIGHLILTADAINGLDLEKVFFIPAWISPFKKDAENTPFQYRFEMLQIAIEDKDFFEVLDIEGKRKGISYTYTTLMELKEKGEDICLLIGEDQAKEFTSWYRWEDIISMVDIFVFRRGKEDWNYPDFFELLNSRMIEVSSSEIRDAIREGKSVDYLVPDRVLQYIEEKKLYKA
ncbi:nicotinate (nicotinamide) nucleotide adenylyltransferase [candidate division WOR-3 bacterium]|nr:nicotinate (nicotinamide) nucleotide adenylyltransferase [candidate division WOR-3 bacterium]MCK4528676.1 nicotinate (nicotinamide) nucleotide adenylyltransferase [candidate division WOR-3 bacterium]